MGKRKKHNERKKFKKSELTDEIIRFISEFGRIPIAKDFEHLDGYPHRKTLTNHFGSFNDALRAAGVEPIKLSRKEHHLKYNNKEYLSSAIFDYIDATGEVPTLKKLIEYHSMHSLKNKYEKIYGGFNNALIELGLELNSVSQYTDDELRQYFENFVLKYKRIPRIHEFNKSKDYPSFWCYQKRYGSWNKAVIAYGYLPNDSNRKYVLDDGEICASAYEYDFSIWLKNKNIRYERNVLYRNIDLDYEGKMDCDYVITIGDNIYYIEVAGFISEREKISDAEQMYLFKLRYKEKLLLRNGLKFLFLKPHHFDDFSFESETEYFLNLKGE